MATRIDARGLSCPQPVLLFLSAAKEHAVGPFSVLVDNDASLENVRRAARNQGFAVQSMEEGPGVIRLEISRE